MPLLDRDGLKAEGWTRSEGAAIDNIAQAIVPWEALGEALGQRAPGQQIGVQIANNLRFAEIEPVLGQLALVAIAFPAYSDGRGFSLAKLIHDSGFAGTLRASGPLIADQFAYALSCGFDEIELPEALAARQPMEQWLGAVDSISHGYQRGYGDERSILDQRRAARAAE